MTILEDILENEWHFFPMISQGNNINFQIPFFNGVLYCILPGHWH